MQIYIVEAEQFVSSSPVYLCLNTETSASPSSPKPTVSNPQFKPLNINTITYYGIQNMHGSHAQLPQHVSHISGFESDWKHQQKKKKKSTILSHL